MRLYIKSGEVPISNDAQGSMEGMGEFLKMLVDEHGLYDMWVVVAHFQPEEGVLSDDGNVQSVWMGTPPEAGDLDEGEVAHKIQWPKD